MFGVKNPVELHNLDKIVDELVDQFKGKISKFLVDGNAPMPAVEVAAMEQQWIDELNEKYDEKARKSTGRKVPENWKEGIAWVWGPSIGLIITLILFPGKDNIVVRKRILNREFEKQRGRIFQSFGGAMTEMSNKIDAAFASAYETNESFFSFLKVSTVLFYITMIYS